MITVEHDTLQITDHPHIVKMYQAYETDDRSEEPKRNPAQTSNVADPMSARFSCVPCGRLLSLAQCIFFSS